MLAGGGAGSARATSRRRSSVRRLITLTRLSGILPITLGPAVVIAASDGGGAPCLDAAYSHGPFAGRSAHLTLDIIEM
jgi:hypothetical protein